MCSYVLNMLYLCRKQTGTTLSNLDPAATLVSRIVFNFDLHAYMPCWPNTGPELMRPPQINVKYQFDSITFATSTLKILWQATSYLLV